MNRRRLVLALTAGAAAAALAAAGPALAHTQFVQRAVFHTGTAEYADGVAAKAADFPSAPEWVPDAATGVRVESRTDGPASLVRFDVPAGTPAPACVPVGPNAREPEVLASAPWWPAEMAGRADRQCGEWRVARAGHTYYAWRTRETVD
ncbi:hypothetical protein ACN20G_30765 (plasmid) [Streptomyces sp. BI20]|uniref:hypothetical protein n=1 Tax=Streptomyces sp. BI20 TaxID=3403460 RepID=UPI003C72C7D3